jgi:ATP-dependent DNA ligase
MVRLPQRVEIRRIIANANVLIQEGQYDRDIAEYSKLERLGKEDKMQAKIEEVEKEKRGQRDLQLVQQLIKNGDYTEARKLIKAIPAKTRAAVEAATILKSIPDGNS